MHKSRHRSTNELGRKMGEEGERDVNFGSFYFPLSKSEVPKGGRWVGQTQLCPFLWLGSLGKTRSVVCKESDEREEGACRKECSRLGWPSTHGRGRGWQKQECDGGQNCGDVCGQEYYHVLQMTLAPFLLTNDDTFDFILGLCDFVSRQKRRARRNCFIAPSDEWKWRR